MFYSSRDSTFLERIYGVKVVSELQSKEKREASVRIIVREWEWEMMIARFGHRILEESEHTCEYTHIHTLRARHAPRTMMVQKYRDSLVARRCRYTQMSRNSSLLISQVPLTTNNQIKYQKTNRRFLYSAAIIISIFFIYSN